MTPLPKRVAILALCVSAGVCLAVVQPRAHASETREFSSQEEAELRAGKLVVRPQVRTLRGAQFLGGMSWQLIDAPPEAVWSALNDAKAYQKFLPAAEAVRSMASNGSAESLFVQHRLGFVSGNYWIRVLHDNANRLVRFRMDRTHPSSIRDAWGEIRVTPYGADKSVASLVIMADLGEGLFVGLVRSNIHAWMLRVPELLKKHVEALPLRAAGAPEVVLSPR